MTRKEIQATWKTVTEAVAEDPKLQQLLKDATAMISVGVQAYGSARRLQKLGQKIASGQPLSRYESARFYWSVSVLVNALIMGGVQSYGVSRRIDAYNNK